MNGFRDRLARRLLKVAQAQYEAGERKRLHAGGIQRTVHAAELALWDLLRHPGHTTRREGMTHNEFVDYLHARVWWALFYSVLFGGLVAADIAPGSPGAIRVAVLYVLLVPMSIIVMSLALLFQQCGWFENVKHPETIPVGSRCFICRVELETGDRVRPSFWGEAPEESFCHIDCEDPKGINVDWLNLKPF